MGRLLGTLEYKADYTSKEYTEIHLKSKNERYIDSPNKILLVLATSSLFSADVSYHNSCYESFRHHWWEQRPTATHNNPQRPKTIQNNTQLPNKK